MWCTAAIKATSPSPTPTLEYRAGCPLHSCTHEPGDPQGPGVHQREVRASNSKRAPGPAPLQTGERPGVEGAGSCSLGLSLTLVTGTSLLTPGMPLQNRPSMDGGNGCTRREHT